VESSEYGSRRERGTAEINVSQSSIFSSILPQRLAAAKFDPQAAVIRVESLRVARLDDVLAEFPQAKASYLNIDTQGYERRSVSLTSWASRWNSPLSIFIKGPGGSTKPSHL
jgi:hypothetical protein